MGRITTETALILMDVDGVLNPWTSWNALEQEHMVTLSNDRRVLLGYASTLGTIVWATSCSLSVTEQLDCQAGITGTTFRIPLGGAAARETTAETPKLGRLSRWITRYIAETPDKNAVVAWIDDFHGRDAHEWAASCGFPVLLATTQPQRGLTAEDLEKVRGWTRGPRPVR